MTQQIPLYRTALFVPLASLALALLLLLCLSPRMVQAQTDEIPLVLQDSTNETDFTTSQAWGDYDNDGDLDLVVGNGIVITEDIPLFSQNELLRNFFVKSDRRNRLYCNHDGVLRLCWSSPQNDFTTSVAWGDMDNDGDLDLAVGNARLGVKAKNVPVPLLFGRTAIIPVVRFNGMAESRVYRNNGNSPTGEPQFEVIWSSPMGDSVMSVAWGDYDKDGKLDLAMAHSGHYIVADVSNPGRPAYENAPSFNRIYHNNIGLAASGQPTFSLDTDFHSQSDISFSVAWVDVDNDTDLDLAVVNGKRMIEGELDPAAGNDGLERIYCNQHSSSGIATLEPCWTSTEGDFSTSMSWGDIDDNGYLDMAVGNAQLWKGEINDIYFNYGLDENGSLLLNDEWNSDEADATISVALGDADGDGDLDLAVGNGNFNANQSNRVYCNENGRLRTTACWSSAEEDITLSVAWADMDGDGALDLATGNFSVPIGQQNRFYHNDRVRFPRHFSAWSAEEGNYTRSLAWGDMDGDQDLDLILGNSGFDQLYCNRAGKLVLATTFTPVWDDTRTVAWGDMDGDQDLDLVVGNGLGEPDRLYRNDGSPDECQPIFTSVLTWGQEDDTRSLAWGDMDGDGDLDLAAGNGSTNQFDLPMGEYNYIYRNDGRDAVGNPVFNIVWVSPEADATRSLAWGDVDNDGDLDLAVGNSANFNRVYRNDGMINENQAAFTQVWTATQLEDTNSIAWGDMDGDGDLDLAIGNTTQSSRVYCNENGVLSTSDCWHSVEAARTRSIAWGDLDGDGDLDLAAGNQEGSNYIYLNRNGMLTSRAVWTSDDTSVFTDSAAISYTLSVAWGDLDGDGDLDLAAGNANGQVSGIYANLGRALILNDGLSIAATLVGGKCQSATYSSCFRKGTPPFANVFRPGATPGATLFSTAEIVTATEAVAITYQLFASTDGTRVRIFPEYSPNGGNYWLPATPGSGGDGVVDLLASTWPTGTRHVFVWNAARDIIKSDNVIFRIRTYAGQLHSPILWPALGSQSPPFRMAAPWYVHVVDRSGQPVAGAALYADGQFIATTDRAGLVGVYALTSTMTITDLSLVALAPKFEYPTWRQAHADELAYRIYLTTLAQRVEGLNMPQISTAAGEQRLTTTVTMPLVLFNLLVSIEWPADITYTHSISQAIRHASDYLFDLTDGQMAFGQVTIYDNAQHWSEADIQISAKNTVRPHAYIGGITTTATSAALRLGRAWDGKNSDRGAWNERNGYRTITHEFGHYGLSLYDEYFGYLESPNNTLGKLVEDLYCISETNRMTTTDATNASAMDYQYTSSEFSDQRVAGVLWGSDCTFTAQWQLTKLKVGHGESTWDTLVRNYTDTVAPSDWLLLKPSDRGGVLAGPTDLPPSLPDWPHIQIGWAGETLPTRTLTIVGPDNLPFANAGVTLFKANRGMVIEQGRTSADGQLVILGSAPDDTIRADSIDGALAGSLVVTDTTKLTLRLEQVGNTVNLLRLLPGVATQPQRTPYLRIVPEAARQNQDAINISFTAHNFDQPQGAQSALTVIISKPGAEYARFTQASYSQTTDNYASQLTFTASTEDTNNVQVIGAVDKEVFFLHSTYRLQRVANDEWQTVRSSDGKLSLDLNAQSLPGTQSYLIVTAQNTTPGPLPTGRTVVGHVYDITAGASVTHVELTATLTIAYDSNLLLADPAQAELELYWWDAGNRQWKLQEEAILDRERMVMSAGVRALGAYAILVKQ